MKFVCLDTEECLFVQKIEDLSFEINLSNKFHECPYCFQLAVLVPDDFDFELTKEESFFIYYKINKKILNDKNF